MTNEESSIYSEKFLRNLLLGNRGNCSLIAREYLSKNPNYIEFYELVIKVSLYEVGRLWETNQIGVVTEHLATAITEGILNENFEELISSKRVKRKVIVTCAENEQHQVGAKMVADTFEMAGWDSYFVGASVPASELFRYIDQINPDLIAISLSIYFNLAKLIRLTEKIRTDYPDLTIIIGGQAFRHLPCEITSKLGNAVLFIDLFQLETYLQNLNSNTDEHGKR
jgi:methanogenic corrinoid protein MtbC1